MSFHFVVVLAHVVVAVVNRLEKRGSGGIGGGGGGGVGVVAVRLPQAQ